jgi:hypothetical protein
MGIAIFGSLTAVITSLVLEPAKDANDPILAKLEKEKRNWWKTLIAARKRKERKTISQTQGGDLYPRKSAACPP